MPSSLQWEGYYVNVSICAIHDLYPAATSAMEVFDLAVRDGLLTVAEIEAFNAWNAQVC